MEKGNFVISLDFELLWGVRDLSDISSYGDNIKNVWKVLPKMLQLFEEYNIEATFAVVGILFFKNSKELNNNIPTLKPTYKDDNLSPYNGYFNLLKDSNNYKYHFAPGLIDMIREKKHEIGTHTFSHYYCLEPGQTEEQFEKDILTYIEIAKEKGYATTSIIFPRNQYNSNYLNICANHGIKTFRGNENNWIFKKSSQKTMFLIKRGIRFSDRYINLTGNHCYNLKQINNADSFIINIPSSRFLAPVSKKLKFFEKIRLKRITKSMDYAAKNGLTYHLWWHPHNFGLNSQKNFDFLESILKHYIFLNNKYSFQSRTMSHLCNEYKNNE